MRCLISENPAKVNYLQILPLQNRSSAIAIDTSYTEHTTKQHIAHIAFLSFFRLSYRSFHQHVLITALPHRRQSRAPTIYRQV